ncbi:unnamed protein product [Meloidogyne enterolobii]|uniref:Uncharacterized protein n=1 Tax=Meloidogyne enterolobii TaxID=390850 RepID=A0ACB0Y0W5_MELEN
MQYYCLWINAKQKINNENLIPTTLTHDPDYIRYLLLGRFVHFSSCWHFVQFSTCWHFVQTSYLAFHNPPMSSFLHYSFSQQIYLFIQSFFSFSRSTPHILCLYLLSLLKERGECFLSSKSIFKCFCILLKKIIKYICIF